MVVQAIVVGIFMGLLLSFYCMMGNRTEPLPRIETDKEIETISRNRQAGGA